MDLEPLIVAAAKAGQDFHIPAGTYPPFYLRGAVASKIVTITADPGVVLSFVAQGAENLTFSGLELVVDPKQGAAVSLQNCKNLTLDDCNLHGKAVGDGLGVKVSGGTGITVQASEFHDLQGGPSVSQCVGFTLQANRFHDIQIDGVQLAGCSSVQILGNDFRDWVKQPLDHSDAIQFVGTSTPVHDILVRGNVYERGKGSTPGIQGIFIGDENGQTYENVTVDGNAIVGGDYNSITVAGALSGSITNNLVAGYADHDAWLNIKPSCGPLKAAGNTSTSYVLPPGVTVDASNKTIAKPALGDVAVLEAWQGVPADPPPVTVDPRDAQIADLNARLAAMRQAFANIVTLAQASSAKRVGPTKADNTAILKIAQPLAQ
jgi:hypothetical protein